VVCRHLGYGEPISVKGSAAYGRGSGTIWLDDMACVGTEPTLSDCFHLGPGNHNCGHSEDVGVVCKGNYHIASLYGEDLFLQIVTIHKFAINLLSYLVTPVILCHHEIIANCMSLRWCTVSVLLL